MKITTSWSSLFTQLEIYKLIYCVSLFSDAAHSHSKACTISFPDICSISIQRLTSQGCFVWFFVSLQLVSHLGFAFPHINIFVCWRSIACTFTRDCLFICLFSHSCRHVWQGCTLPDVCSALT